MCQHGNLPVEPKGIPSQKLVGGLEHGFICAHVSHILGIIIPTDELIFFRGVGSTINIINQKVVQGPLHITCITGWWFGTCFIFPYVGNFIISADFHIFQRDFSSTTNHVHRYSIDDP